MKISVNDTDSQQPTRAVSRPMIMSAVLCLAVAVALTAAACSSGSTDASTDGPSSGSGGTGEVTTVSYAYLGNSAGLMPELLMADNPGMCVDYGVKPEMRIVSQAAAPGALAAGQIQGVRTGSGSFLIAAAKDPSATTIVGAFAPHPLYLFVTKDIKSIDDLKGKTIGAPAKGSTSDLALHELLDQHGLTIGKDVKITYSRSSSALFGEAASGTIQGFLYSPPVPPVAGKSGVHKLLSLEGIPEIENLGKTVIGVSTNFLKNNKAAVKGLLACIDAAAKKIQEDRAHAVSVLARGESVSKGQAEAEIQAHADGGSYEMIPFTSDDASSVMHELEKFGVADFGSLDPSTVTDNTLLPASS